MVNRASSVWPHKCYGWHSTWHLPVSKALSIQASLYPLCERHSMGLHPACSWVARRHTRESYCETPSQRFHYYCPLNLAQQCFRALSDSTCKCQQKHQQGQIRSTDTVSSNWIVNNKMYLTNPRLLINVRNNIPSSKWRVSYLTICQFLYVTCSHCHSSSNDNGLFNYLIPVRNGKGPQYTITPLLAKYLFHYWSHIFHVKITW